MERGGPELPAAAAPQIETDDQTALVSKLRNKGGKSNLASAGFNIINSIIGSGIIGLPYSMKEAGFPLGVLLLFGVAYITDYSIILLIKGGNLSSTNSYQELVRKTYGFIGYLILSTLQFLYPFIAMISYNIITGDTLTKVFLRIPGVDPDNILTDRHFIILLTTIIFTLPLSLYRDIAKLGKVSLISLILTIVILVIVMVRTVTLGPQVLLSGMLVLTARFMLSTKDAFDPSSELLLNTFRSIGFRSVSSGIPFKSLATIPVSMLLSLVSYVAYLWEVSIPKVWKCFSKNLQEYITLPKSENAWIFAKSNAVQAVGVMSFAFICHHNSFLIYGSLEEPTLNNWSRITHVSVSLAVVISVLFAACGYMTFTGYTEGDIFENYCRDDNLATFGRFCYGVTVILTFPLECFVTREENERKINPADLIKPVLKVFCNFSNAFYELVLEADEDVFLKQASKVIANVFFHGNLSTVFHIVVTVIIIAVATGVSLVYDCLGIVLELNGVLSATPLVFIIPTACYLKLSKERWNHSDNLISCLILVIGVLVMTVGFVLTLLHPQECSHGKEMFYCFSSNVSFHNSTLPP